MSVRKRLRTKFVRFRKKRGTREVERVKRSLNSWFCSEQIKELPRRKESKNGKLNDERASDINNQPKHKLQINDNRNTRGPVGRTDNNHRTRSTAGRARERNGITTDRVCSWPLAVAEQLGSLGYTVLGGRLHCCYAELAGRSRNCWRGECKPRNLREQNCWAGRGPLRRSHPQIDEKAGHYRSLFRRPSIAYSRRSWALRSHGRHRSRSFPMS